MTDIRDYDNIVDAINCIINNHGIAEIKIENWDSKSVLTVVEQTRALKATMPKDKK